MATVHPAIVHGATATSANRAAAVPEDDGVPIDTVRSRRVVHEELEPHLYLLRLIPQFCRRCERRPMANCWLDVLLSPPSLPHRSSASLPHVSSPSPSCREKPRHRVAFLVAGVARGFDRPRLQRAFFQHVVLPLAPYHTQRDIFLALKLVNRTTSLYGKPWTEIETDAAALERGAHVLQSRAVHLSYASTDDGAARLYTGRVCGWCG